MAPHTTIELIGAILFLIAIIHTFSTKYIEHLAHVHKRFSGILHLLGEIEVVFGFWAMVFILFIFSLEGHDSAVNYVDARNFTEPMFVFVIMVIAATRPILELAKGIVFRVSSFVPLKTEIVIYFLLLSLVPLLGSFITEPAAMTLAALLLSQNFFSNKVSTHFKYATMGVLFVNISIGGALTPYAAPPILMVSNTWNWDIWYMLSNLGWRSATGVLINAIIISFLFKKDLSKITFKKKTGSQMPLSIIAAHLFFLVNVVYFAHHPAMFMGLFLFFIGFTIAYERYQNPLIIKEALLVAFFLAGLVVLGGIQGWWITPVLLSMDSSAVYYGATGLTALTDNAALTYLGSLVEGLSDEFKLALVSGAITGGGLTVIANAPNPAGVSILRKHFSEKHISPLSLLLYAIPPTIIAIIAFRFL